MNPDPFASFMAHWTPTLGMAGAFDAFLRKEEQREAAYVMPDIEPFRANDGAHIGSRVQWREHLKMTGAEEYGHADLKYMAREAEKRGALKRERLKAAERLSKTEYVEDFRPAEPTKLQREVANRLHGRKPPPRKELIKLALDIGRRLK